MRTPTLTGLAVCTTLALAALACSDGGEEFTPPPPFEDTEDVKVWATTASAVAIYSNVYRDIAVFQGEQSYADAGCPAIEDDGSTWIATGDCIDSDDKEWQGKLTIERDGDDFVSTYDGFENHEGTFSVRQVEPGLHEFEAELVFGGFTTVDYKGTVQGGYEGRTIWNGSGSVERNGFVGPNGTVEATTLAEIVDNDVCAGEPLAGSTTLTSGDDVAVITYDGETDCDDEKNAQLTVNDEERGMIDGINCAIEAPGASRTSSWAFAVVLGACLALRRRAARAAREASSPRER
jgi:hypothetical protein